MSAHRTSRRRDETRPQGKVDSDDRRGKIVTAAGQTFIRYGFRKTSMDDVARNAKITRQGLYLHFSSKEALFRAVVAHLVEAAQTAGRAALNRFDLGLEHRLLGAFDAIYDSALADAGSPHLDELLAAAAELTPNAVRRMESAIIGDLEKVLTKHFADAERQDGITPKAVAELLYATSSGLKQRGASRSHYRASMRVMVSLVVQFPTGDRSLD